LHLGTERHGGLSLNGVELTDWTGHSFFSVPYFLTLGNACSPYLALVFDGLVNYLIRERKIAAVHERTIPSRLNHGGHSSDCSGRSHHCLHHSDHIFWEASGFTVSAAPPEF
jgi:hypothetical protein